MELVLKRINQTPDYTEGVLYIDGDRFCDTIEDRVRPEGEKVPGETAIPAGRYRVTLSYSPKFKKVMPEVKNVPMFTGIRIHAGNTAKDSQGCILVGKKTAPGEIRKSRDTFSELMREMTIDKSDAYLTIENV